MSDTKTIAIANQKGGVGKTTTAVNMAACLGDAGYRVLVIDLDPQANATSGLGLTQQQGTSLYSALLNAGDVTPLIQHTVAENVDIIPSEVDLAGSEIDIARSDDYLHCFRKALSPVILAGTYNFIIIDCPPSLGILTMNAVTAADSMIVPMQCEYYALEGLSVITRLISQIRDTGANTKLELEGILMTMFDGRTNLAQEVVKEVKEHFPDKVYETMIPRNIRLSEAPSFGKPVIMHDRNSVGAKAYLLFTAEFLTRTGIPTDCVAVP